MSEQPGSPSRGGQQRYSLFHATDAAEAGLKAWHAPYADAFCGCGEVLDLGCGPGYFLDLLRERDVHGIGIDIDPAMTAAARRRGHDARVGDQHAVAAFPGTLGGIHLSHVIEHLWGDDAVGLLEASYGALRDDGILIVRTPNWGNATVRHGGFWMDHTHKRPYPLELLTKILGDVGFEIVRSGFEPGGWQDTYIIARKRPRPVLRARLRWHGDFLDDGSIARINRNLARAVADLSAIDVIPYGEPTDEVELALGLPPRRAGDEPDDGLPSIVLRHGAQPHFMNPDGVRYVHLQPWEFGAAPRDWVEHLAQRADDVWCSSRAQRDAYVAAGMPAERTFVVPPGFDPAIFRTDAAPFPTDNPDACIFLYVGGLGPRSSIAKLLDAYTQAFAPTDPVALLVACDASAGVDAAVADQLRALAPRNDIPPVRLYEAALPDGDLARLYRTATAFVHPYRTEAFGLRLLEAMACGIPVVVSAGGPADDFVDESVGYVVPAARIPLGRAVDDVQLGADGWALEPSTDALVGVLRRIATQRTEARAHGAAAAARALDGWTWGHAAQHLVRRVDALLARAPVGRASYTDELNAYEAKFCSQNGEDGMLAELFSRLRVVEPFFVEFGVETGVECNAAYLARRFGWAGLMLEGDAAKYEQLRANYAAFPRVQTGQAMVTRENIVELFRRFNVPAEFDLLSIDVDGNDYYLWETLTDFRPRVVVVEINPAYPPPQRWAITYNPLHSWRGDDYYGASLSTYTALAERLGYALLATDFNSVNAIFLRRDLLACTGFPAKRPEQAFHPPRYRHPHRDGPSLAL